MIDGIALGIGSPPGFWQGFTGCANPERTRLAACAGGLWAFDLNHLQGTIQGLAEAQILPQPDENMTEFWIFGFDGLIRCPPSRRIFEAEFHAMLGQPT